MIADLSALLAKAAAQAQAASLSLKHITLRRTATDSIKRLSGFRGGHKVPDYRSQRTEEWVSELAEGDLRDEIETFFEGVKNSGVYKSRDIKYDSPANGGASIRTPDFEFSISYSQSEQYPGQYEVRYELLRLNTPEILDTDWFNNLFRRVFDEAVFEFSGKVNVEKLIDRAEEIEDLSVDYDGNRSYCSIRFSGFEGEVTVTEDSLTYSFRRAETPKEMALQLQAAQGVLLSIPAMHKALPL